MRKLGVFCLLLGICCIFSAAGFVVYNHLEQSRAGEASDSLLQDVQEVIIRLPQNTQQQAEETVVSYEETVPEEEIVETVPVAQEILTTKVQGYDCIGVLSIPVLELELPVLTNWSYEKLQVAPCHYFGSYYEPNFVIAAHNFPSHFGRLSELQEKDLILFTDISGTVRAYEVVLLETLPGNATKEMITSGFDLSLYTCTPGGASRVTVRCTAVKVGS